MENLNNKTRQQILSLLMRTPSLSAKQIFSKSKLKYKTVYKELQQLVALQVLLKDVNRLYRINPGYGDKLIDYGLQIKGLKKLPDKILFLNNFNEIKQKIYQMEEYLKKI